MKIGFIIFTGIMVFSASAEARDTYVRGYTQKNGTYVQPYHRSASDNSAVNNYGSRGNYNPYSGKQGQENPYNADNNYTGRNQGNRNYEDGDYNEYRQ